MNGLHELPLIVFTVLAQSVVGAFILFAFAIYKTNNADSLKYIHRAMFIILTLLGIGFFASILHLGTPQRAFNSLNRIGSSMLSNEIASGSLFFGLAGFYWLLSLFNRVPEGLKKLWPIGTAIIGIIFIYIMQGVYQINTVPTWYTPITTVAFFMTTLVGGIALGYGLLQPNTHKEYSLKWLPYFYFVGVILIAVLIVCQTYSLSNISSSIQRAQDLVPDYVALMALRLFILGIVSIMLIRSQKLSVLTVAVLLTLFAEMIGRTLFYGLHMTVGMAIAG